MKPAVGKAPEAKPPTVSREQLAALRKELNGLVGAWSHRTGQPHGVIHNELRSACGGPALPQASAEQIKARIEQDPPVGPVPPLTSAFPNRIPADLR